jgi:hypothetical protein
MKDPIKPYASYLTNLESHFDDILDQAENEFDKLMNSRDFYERFIALIHYTKVLSLNFERELAAELAVNSVVDESKVIRLNGVNVNNKTLEAAIAKGNPVTNVAVFKPKQTIAFGRPLRAAPQDGSVA